MLSYSTTNTTFTLQNTTNGIYTYMYLGVKLDKWLLYTAQLYTLHIICSSSNSTTQSLSCHKEVQTILKPPANFSTCSQMGLKSFGWFTSCQAHIKAVRAGKWLSGWLTSGLCSPTPASRSVNLCCAWVCTYTLIKGCTELDTHAQMKENPVL